MNDRQYEKRVAQDAAKAQKNLTSILNNSVNQVESKAEKFAEDARDAYNNTSASVKKEVVHGLGQYNAKAQEYVEMIPGGLAEKVAKYPWVAISIGVAIGVILGGLLKPTQRF